MGGKHKQSQRTKNNVRPSNSGRSAEHLSNVNLETGLMGMGARNMLPALFPTLAPVNLDYGNNPELQMCLKKLNKKDPITKTKALQELNEIVNNSKADDIVAALPSWAHFYKNLTVDTDRKVRECTQICHGSIVKLCGRKIAPHLKQLIPPWLQAQHDEHAPAHSQAHNSLTSTFPDSKLPEVIAFCKGEIIAHLLDNLNGSADFLLSKKASGDEDAELQHVCAVGGALRGLAYFVRRAPPALGDWLWEALRPLLHARTYWLLHAHPAPLLRASWYATTGQLVERFGDTFAEEYGAKALRLVVGAAGERATGGGGVPERWACLLTFMHAVEDWQKYLDKKELLTKRILEVLENGGWGDARQLSDMLLPILAHLPRNTSTKEFYVAFFNAIYSGLEKKNILSSRSERQSWISGLAECLRYLSVQQTDYAVEIATGVHRTWLEKILYNNFDIQLKLSLIKFSAGNMASIVKYWLKQSTDENGEKYDQLVRNFWQNVGSTALAQIEKLSMSLDEITRVIDGHVLLLQTLKSSFHNDAKKQQSIRFDGDLQVSEEKPAVSICGVAITERYNHNLNDLVHKICSHYLEFADKNQVSNVILTPLISLLNEFDSKELYLAISIQFDSDSAYKMYDKVLRNWLAGDTMRCKAVVDVVFLMMKHCNEDEQDSMFESFKQFPPSVVERGISLALSHPYCGHPSVQKWLRGSLVEATVVHVCRRSVREDDASAARFVAACLAPDAAGETTISPSAVTSVVQVVREGVRAAEGAQGAARAARLASALWPAGALAPAAPFGSLFLDLFELTLPVPRGADGSSVATWCEVRAAWREGLATLPATLLAELRGQAASLLHERLALQADELDMENVDHLASLCPYLLNQTEVLRPDDVAQIIDFTERLLDIDTNSIEYFALRHDCIALNLNCPFDDDNDVIKAIVQESSAVKELAEIDFISFANKFLFRSTYMRNLLLHKVEDDDEIEGKTWCGVLLADQYIETTFCNILYEYMVVCTLYEGYGFWPHYNLIQETKHKLDTLITDIIKETPAHVQTKILESLSQSASSTGYYWSQARRYYEVKTRSGERSDNLNNDTDFDLSKIDQVVTGNGFFHTLQANTKWSTDVNLSYKTKYLIMLRSLYACHATEPEVIDAQFARDVAEAYPHCGLDVVVNAYYRHNHIMLYERDVADAPWRQLVSNACVADFLAAHVEAHGWTAPDHHWDFTTIALCSLLRSLAYSKRHWHSTGVAMLTRAVLNLFAAVDEFVSTSRGESLRRQPTEHAARLPTEWRDVFAPDLHVDLLALMEHVLGSQADADVASAAHAAALEALVAAARRFRWAALPEGARGGGAARRAAAEGARAAARGGARGALGATLLAALAEPLVLEDAAALQAWSERCAAAGGEAEGGAEGGATGGAEGGEARPRLALECFAEEFRRAERLVLAALAGVEVGEGSCEMAPFSAPYVAAEGWLRLALALHEVARRARGDLMHHYMQIYRECEYCAGVLSAALRLLPAIVHAHARAPPSAPLAPHARELFLHTERFSVYGAASAHALGALACRAVFVCVSGAGAAAARSWWGAAGRRARALLQRLVADAVAPQLVRDQLADVQRRAHSLEDAQVTVHHSSYEVECVFTVEDRPLELRVTLARDHPLGLPRLFVPPATVAAAPAVHTHWITMYLAYQNGSVFEALKMWTRAVSTRVERAPHCYICYCRLEPGGGALPRVPCRQCRNKFHTSCLRKWFASSSKSSCPLCRTKF